jgi:hypothetical protein
VKIIINIASAHNPKPDLTSSRDHIRRLHNQATTNISRMLPDIHPEITTTKQEIRTDPSHLHHKHDNPHHKTAFHEVIKEISHTITEDRWTTAYKRIYDSNIRTTLLHRAPGTQ